VKANTPIVMSLCVLITALMTACARQAEPESSPHADALERDLVGQLVLPSGVGSRGVELVITASEAGGEPRPSWVQFDEQGRFAHSFRGTLNSLSVSTGVWAELERLDAEELSQVDDAGHVDVGVIDLRDRLTAHRVVTRAAEGAPAGEVRIAMCFGLPPVGPAGGRMELGSRQFPPVPLGAEVEWLLPRAAPSVYFLVERPLDPGREGTWRTGSQQLFGPFTSATLPAELSVD
jgi:hypothetical protein